VHHQQDAHEVLIALLEQMQVRQVVTLLRLLKYDAEGGRVYHQLDAHEFLIALLKSSAKV
jgi:hypothetical protein